jgi:hypothetical protein
MVGPRGYDQRRQAEAAGFAIDEVIADQGVSGISTHSRIGSKDGGCSICSAPGIRWLCAGSTASGVTTADDNSDVCDTIREFMRRGGRVQTVINGLVFDRGTKDPMQQAVRDTLIGFMAALSQAQAEATKESQRAGTQGPRRPTLIIAAGIRLTRGTSSITFSRCWARRRIRRPSPKPSGCRGRPCSGSRRIRPRHTGSRCFGATIRQQRVVRPGPAPHRGTHQQA